MGLPRPDPFTIPETPEEFLSDYLLHAAVAAGTVIGVYAYTGLYAGPGIAGTIYMAMFSSAEVGAAGAGSVALADTVYAMSVYAEPFVAAARFVAPAVVPLTAAAVFYHGGTWLESKLGLPSRPILMSQTEMDRQLAVSGLSIE